MFALIYLNWNNNGKRYSRKCILFLPKGTVKNYDAIINGKNVYDQLIDSDRKRYEEIMIWIRL